MYRHGFGISHGLAKARDRRPSFHRWLLLAVLLISATGATPAYADHLGLFQSRLRSGMVTPMSTGRYRFMEEPLPKPLATAH